MSELDIDGLRDPEPRAPGSAEREAVAFRARSLRTRHMRRTLLIAVVCVTVGAGAIGAVVARTNDNGHGVVVAPAPTTVAPASFVADARCFVSPTAPTDTDDGATLTVANMPAGSRRLLVLERSGDLWVVDNGRATLWASGSIANPNYTAYVWARWAADGSIYASRIGAHSIELDHLTAPAESQPVAQWPYSVRATAPAGYCPIDGYLASFGITAHGFALLNHQAGPIPHSCPAIVEQTTVTASPWRCQSPEGAGPELRADPAVKGAPSGTFLGGGQPGAIFSLVSSHPGSEAVAIDDGSTVTIAALRTGTFPSCCSGGQQGTAYALDANGSELEYASRASNGRYLWSSTLDGVGEALWQSTDAINSIASSTNWLAVAHGTNVTLVAADDGKTVLTLAGLPSEAVATLDWAP